MTKRYRITKGFAYNGCEPITVYWVQVRKDGFFGHKWENVKGFEEYTRAEQLLEFLRK